MRGEVAQAISENEPAYFYSLLILKWELILHGNELARFNEVG